MGTELAARPGRGHRVCGLILLVIRGTAEIKNRGRRRVLDSRIDIESPRTLIRQEFEQLAGEAYH